ncbi:MAG TPA: hypothetical protein VJ576_20825 [Rhodocyclaceae bacterium]|nr:hypothetical protein [Rhodocyclaceae bacterium]
MQRVDWDRPLVNRFWNGVSPPRLEEISFAKQAGNKLIEAIAEYLPPGTRCLDFGAGNGELVRILLISSASPPATSGRCLMWS